MRRGWRTINATSANPPMHELSWSFLLFFCQKLTQDSNNNIRFSPPCDVLAHIRPWKIKLEPSAPSQTHLNWKKGREKLEATRPKNKRNYLIFSHFPPQVSWLRGPLPGGRIGREVTTKREWLFERSSELFNPKHKTTWQTQNGIPFQKPPCCCLFPCCVYLTPFTACAECAEYVVAANMLISQKTK